MPDPDTTLLLVHGWCGHRGLWQAQVAHFSHQYRVLAPDLAGHGHCPAGPGPWTVQAYGQQLAELLQDPASGPVILLGHSMGGAACVEAAGHCPERVSAVILVDTFLFDYGHFSEEAVTQILAGISADLPAAIAKILQDTVPANAPAGLREQLRQTMARTPLSVALPAFESLLRWRLLDTQLQRPLYAINGELVNPHASARYRHLIHEYAMPGAGHFPHLEQASRFNRLLEKVLADIQQNTAP